MTMSVAVVIPTHNRYIMLGRLLRSLSRIPVHLVDRIVVVDDSSTKLPLDVHGFDAKVIHVRLGERVYISRAKNIGWRNTNEPYVLFVDDDNVVPESTVAKLLRVMEDNKRIGALMPSVLYLKDPSLVWVYAPVFKSDRWEFNLLGRNLPRNTKLEGALIGVDALPNCFMVRRAVLDSLGGFDERYRVNSSSNFCLRLKKAGFAAAAYTGAFVYHDVEPPGKFGWWSRHGAVDSQRVFHEVNDWYMWVGSTHSSSPIWRLQALVRSARFIGPNGFSYLLTKSPEGCRSFIQLIRGSLAGLGARKVDHLL